MKRSEFVRQLGEWGSMYQAPLGATDEDIADAIITKALEMGMQPPGGKWDAEDPVKSETGLPGHQDPSLD